MNYLWYSTRFWFIDFGNIVVLSWPRCSCAMHSVIKSAFKDPMKLALELPGKQLLLSKQ